VPPTRVKPIPITLVLYLLRVAHNVTRQQAHMAIADMIVIAFFFLLRPGEYTGTNTDGRPFFIEDTALHLGKRRLNLQTATIAELEAATACSYTFTTQKNGVRGEVVMHSRSGHPLCCPVTATIRRVLYHRRHNTPHNQPLASHYIRNRRSTIKANDITVQLRMAAGANIHVTGLDPSEISARSLRAGGAMALLCGKVDHNLIQLLGRWHSDSMLRYLHLQAQPIMKQFAKAMFNNGTYDFLPTETVPIKPNEP